VPTILFTVLGLVDGIAGHFRLLPWHTFLTPLGIYGLAYLLIAMLRDQVLREQDLAMRNINLEYEAARAVERAETDPLTGAYNRHYLQAVMQSEGIKEPYSVLLFDIDHFKEINDTHGHDKGDAVLVSFAMILREGLDKDKLLVRWGGEEFLVLCPHMGIRMASRLGENLRKSVGSHFLAGLRLTCSIGAATWHGEEDTIEELFKRADQALYTAKESGRDRLVTENEITK
jgi:diguanylate cyclase (GGDEF)-like protein